MLVKITRFLFYVIVRLDSLGFGFFVLVNFFGFPAPIFIFPLFNSIPNLESSLLCHNARAL